MDTFLDIQATKDTVIRSGIANLQCTRHYFREIRYNIVARKAAARLIKPEPLSPTEGAAAQHSLRAYLQTQDWMLLQSMSLNPDEYGWTVGVHGYEPLPPLDLMESEELAVIVMKIAAGSDDLHNLGHFFVGSSGSHPQTRLSGCDPDIIIMFFRKQCWHLVSE